MGNCLPCLYHLWQSIFRTSGRVVHHDQRELIPDKDETSLIDVPKSKTGNSRIRRKKEKSFLSDINIDSSKGLEEWGSSNTRSLNEN